MWLSNISRGLNIFVITACSIVDWAGRSIGVHSVAFQAGAGQAECWRAGLGEVLGGQAGRSVWQARPGQNIGGPCRAEHLHVLRWMADSTLFTEVARIEPAQCIIWLGGRRGADWQAADSFSHDICGSDYNYGVLSFLPKIIISSHRSTF